MINIRDEKDVQIWCDYQEEVRQTSADYFLRLRFSNFHTFLAVVENWNSELGDNFGDGIGYGDGNGDGVVNGDGYGDGYCASNGWYYNCSYGNGVGGGGGYGDNGGRRSSVEIGLGDGQGAGETS